MDAVYLNGRFVAPDQAQVSVMDRGFLFGDGVYEVIPAYGGRPLRCAEHLARLDNSLRGIGMPNPLTAAAWMEVLAQLLAAGPGDAPDGDQALYVQVTRGAAPTRDHRFPEAVEPTVLAMARPLRAREPRIAEAGVAAILCEDIRWQRCDLKTTALIAAVLLRQQAAEADAEEAILVRGGLVVEGSTSNLFVVRAGELVTPPKGPALLPGITRDLVLELARADGIPCVERDLAEAELRSADEIWITSSTREVMPVTRLDGGAVGEGRPGPLWRRIDARYQGYKQRLREGALA